MCCRYSSRKRMRPRLWWVDAVCSSRRSIILPSYLKWTLASISGGLAESAVNGDPANVLVDTGPGSTLARTSASNPMDMWMLTAPASEQQGFVDERSLIERIKEGTDSVTM